MHGTNSNPESAQRLLSDLQVIGIALPDTFHCEMDFEENLEHAKKDLHIQQLFPPSPIYATMLIYFFSISLLSFFNGPIIPCENIVRIGIEWCIYRQFLNLIIDALTICYSLVGFVFLECTCVFKNKIFFFFLHICNFSASHEGQATELLWGIVIRRNRNCFMSV